MLAGNRAAYGNVWFVTGSTFSTVGDCAPVRKLAERKERYRG